MSYSHGADGRLAPALQNGVQRLAKPWYRQRALRVFRDETALSTSPHLWPSIEAALDDSGWYVLLASPDAAQSVWVGRELDRWLATKDIDRILVVLTDGTLAWDEATNTLTGNAIPAALQHAFETEPRHLDMRWAGSESDLDLRNSRFRDACADLAAPIHGIPKDELESEDIRLHRRARRLARAAVTALVLLVVVSLVFGTFALLQRNRANRNAHRADQNATRAEKAATLADARRLAAQARGLAGTHLDLALLLAVEARRLDDSVESRAALEATLVASPQLEQLVQFGAAPAKAALSADGRVLAISHPDGTFGFRNLRTGEATGTVLHLDPDITSSYAIALSRDGRLLATGDRRGTIVVRDVATGRQQGDVLTGVPSAYASVPFSPDARTIAAVPIALTPPRALVWNLDASQPRPATLTVSGGFLGPPTFSPDGRTLALGDSTQVALWDVSGTPRRVGNALAVGGDQGGLRLWDTATQAAIGAPLTGLTQRVSGIAFSPDGATVVAGDGSPTVLAWDARSHQRLRVSLAGLTGSAYFAAFEGADRVVLAGGENAGVWHLRATPPLGRQVGGVGGVSALSPDGATIAVTEVGTNAAVFFDAHGNRTDRKAIPLEDVSIFATVAMAWSPDGKQFALGSVDGLVKFLDATSGALIGEPLRDHTQGIQKVAFSPDGRLIAASSDDGTVIVWDATSHERIGAPLKIGTVVFALAFSPDSKEVVAASGIEGRVVFFDAATHRQLRTLSVGTPVFALAYSPDGTKLAAGIDGAALLIDPATAQSTNVRLAGHGTFVLSIAFSADGRRLATGSFDETVIVWDLATRQPIGEPLAPHMGPVLQATFAPDGRSLLTNHALTQTVLFDVDPESWLRRACALAGRNLTGAEHDLYLPGRPLQATCPQWPLAP